MRHLQVYYINLEFSLGLVSFLEFMLDIDVVKLCLGFFVAFVLLGGVVHETRAGSYYVDGNGGSDSNVGTAEAPWQTVTKAANTVVAGDTVHVKGGVVYIVADLNTSLAAGTSGANITYQSWSGTGVPILESSGADIFNLVRAYTNINGFHFRNANGKCIDSFRGYKFTNNIIEGCGLWGAGTGGSNPMVIAHNIFINNDQDAYGLNVASTNTVIYNNMFIGNSYGISGSGFTGNYNLYWNNTVDCDGCSLGAQDVSLNPQFVDIGKGDYHLRSGSPAIDAGTSSAGVTSDIIGVSRPKGDAVDIGIYEYFDWDFDLMFSEYSNDRSPVFSFRPRVGITSGSFVFNVELDVGKNRAFSEKYIPNVSPDTSVSGYEFKNTDLVKIDYYNWHDADVSNNRIELELKELMQEGRGLTEGRHTWKVTMVDSTGDTTTSTRDFVVDLTAPAVTQVVVIDPMTQKAFFVPSGPVRLRTFVLDVSNRMPVVWVKFVDPKNGSTRDNENGTKDTFEKDRSGMEKAKLVINKLVRQENQCVEDYEWYDTISADLGRDREDVTLRPLFPLTNGVYKMDLILRDKAGNELSYPPFYFSLVTQSRCTLAD